MLGKGVRYSTVYQEKGQATQKMSTSEAGSHLVKQTVCVYRGTFSLSLNTVVGTEHNVCFEWHRDIQLLTQDSSVCVFACLHVGTIASLGFSKNRHRMSL